jgi:hypothetical protein
MSFELLEGFEGVEVRVGVVQPDNKPHRNKIVLQGKITLIPGQPVNLFLPTSESLYVFCCLFGFYFHHQCSIISEYISHSTTIYLSTDIRSLIIACKPQLYANNTVISENKTVWILGLQNSIIL